MENRNTGRETRATKLPMDEVEHEVACSNARKLVPGIFIDGFQLKDQFPFHEKIQPVAAVELHPFVKQRCLALALEDQARSRKFVCERFLIG